MINKFDFITSYKYYGRPKLNEDELDDALGLGANPEQSAAPTDQSAADSSEPSGATDNADGLDAQPTDQPADGAAPETEQKEGAVEVDMTQLVLKQQETVQAVQDMLAKISDLMKSNEDLKLDFQKQIQDVEAKTIEGNNKLKQEIQMRTPTPLEKLQLRSMASFPYNVKLSDYWSPTEEDKYKYSIANGKAPDMSQEEKPALSKAEEFVLKQSDIMKGYDENYVKNTF